MSQDKNLQERFKYLVEKADNGDLESMLVVADCYNKGLYTEKDDQKSHMYYKKAADKGHPKSTFMVAIDYLNGIGTAKNKKEGLKYLNLASSYGVANAQYLLGSLYQAGQVSMFFKEANAMQHFEMAAKQGHGKAQIELANLICTSKSNKHSVDDMLFWLVCAYLHKDKNDPNVQEDSEHAREIINGIIQAGLPGGLERVEKIIDKVEKNYPEYLKNPS